MKPPTQQGRTLGTALPPIAAVITAVCLLSGTGCQLARKTVSLPKEMVGAVAGVPQDTSPDPAVLQSELLRYADDLFGRTSAGLDEYVRLAGTAEAHERALKWRVGLGSSALGIATGANPTANLVDFLGLATLTRIFVEREAALVEPKGAMDVWLGNARVLETNAWKMAQGILSTAQQEEFRTAIARWLKSPAATSYGFFSRPQQITLEVREANVRSSQSGSVFNLVGLDPTAGLDPAVREMTRTRLFAERAMFAMERLPFLLRWQTEMLAGQFLGQPEITNALASADRLSRAAESASQTAALFPDKLTAERKAILAALEEQEGKLKSLSAEVGQTLAAGERMSTSLNTTIASFDLLMKRFNVGETNNSAPKTNSTPFNILDYARTAGEIGNMAQQLDALIKDVNGTMDSPAGEKRIAQLGALSAQARSDAKSVLNHTFILVAGLIVLTFVCALAFRKLGSKRGRSDVQDPDSQQIAEETNAAAPGRGDKPLNPTSRRV